MIICHSNNPNSFVSYDKDYSTLIMMTQETQIVCRLTDEAKEKLVVALLESIPNKDNNDAR